MWDNWLGRRIRRNNPRRAWLGCLVLALFACHAYWLRATLNDIRSGPTPVSLDELSRIKNPDGLDFSHVAFDAGQLADTGFRHAKWDEHYFLCRAGVGYFLVIAPSSQTDGQVTGFICRADSEARHVRAALKKGWPPLAGEFLPFSVDTTRKMTVSLWLRFVVLLPLPLWAGWIFAFAIRRWLDPSRHPIARALARFGRPAEMAARIEEEAGGAAPIRIGPVEVLGNWMLCQDFPARWRIFRLDELVYAEKHILVWNFFFVYRWVSLKDRTGVEFSVSAGEAGIEQILAFLSSQARWVVIRD